MYIMEIAFHNIRECFLDETFILQKGITAIIGPNGSGKSTLLEGISFCLSGQLESSQAQMRRNTNNSLIKLMLSDGVEVQREARRGSSFSLNILEDGLSIDARKINESLAWLEKRYGWDTYLFTNSVYLKQGSSIDLLTKPHEARNFLINLLNFNMWNDYYVFTRALLSQLEVQKTLIAGKKTNALSLIDSLNSTSVDYSHTDLQIIKGKLEDILLKTKQELSVIAKNLSKLEDVQSSISSTVDRTKSSYRVENQVLSTMIKGTCPNCNRAYPASQQQLQEQTEKVTSLADYLEELNLQLLLTNSKRKELLSNEKKVKLFSSNQVDVLKNRVSEITECLKYNDRINTDVQKFEEVVAGCVADLERLEMEAEVLNVLAKAYSPSVGIPKLVLDKELQMLESFINLELDSLSNSSLQIRFVTNKEGKETLECSIICNGVVKSNAFSLSGGQRKRINIAALFGLAEYCGAKHVLLLDEPTDALDEKGREDFMSFLRHKLSKFDQILLATHDTRLVEMADHSLRLG